MLQMNLWKPAQAQTVNEATWSHCDALSGAPSEGLDNKAEINLVGP